jgi:hypothetical protein
VLGFVFFGHGWIPNLYLQTLVLVRRKKWSAKRNIPA